MTNLLSMKKHLPEPSRSNSHKGNLRSAKYECSLEMPDLKHVSSVLIYWLKFIVDIILD